MQLVYDALLRTIIATALAELVSLPFIKISNQSFSAKVYNILIIAIPVFIAMLAYNIIKARINKRTSSS